MVTKITTWVHTNKADTFIIKKTAYFELYLTFHQFDLLMLASVQHNP